MTCAPVVNASALTSTDDARLAQAYSLSIASRNLQTSKAPLESQAQGTTTQESRVYPNGLKNLEPRAS